MARRRQRSGNLRYIFMAVAIAMVLWGIAHGEKRTERNVDIDVYKVVGVRTDQSNKLVRFSSLFRDYYLATT